MALPVCAVAVAQSPVRLVRGRRERLVGVVAPSLNRSPSDDSNGYRAEATADALHQLPHR
jgi:hypothetical protein